MANPSIPPKRVLVVDDETFVADAVKMILVFDGHKVTTTTSGQEALAILEQSPHDLVVTDYTMPRMKGDELAVKIKERWPDMPIIMLTAYAENIRAAGTPLPGVDALLSKPFDLADFRAVVAAAFTRGSSPQSPKG